MPRWIGLAFDTIPNQISTRLSQDPEVGVKWMWMRGFAASQALTFGCLWAA